jgi:CLIP-associating protein 1/2
MEEAIAQLKAKDTKERMAGVERLQLLLEQSRKSLTASEVGNLVDASMSLLKDHNFRVCQGVLQALASAAALAGEHLKVHFNALLPAIVECLGDGKQPVRLAGRHLLLALMEISSPTIILERAGSYAWCHKNWRVREEFARTIASATNLFAATVLPFQRMLLPPVLCPSFRNILRILLDVFWSQGLECWRIRAIDECISILESCLRIYTSL